MQEHHVLYCIARYKKIAVDLNLMRTLKVLTALLYERKGEYWKCSTHVNSTT
jgi:hypothetical protein